MATPMLRKASSYLRLAKFMGRLLWSFLKKKYCCFTKHNENSRCSPLCAATVSSRVHLKTLPSVQYRLDNITIKSSPSRVTWRKNRIRLAVAITSFPRERQKNNVALSSSSGLDARARITVQLVSDDTRVRLNQST